MCADQKKFLDSLPNKPGVYQMYDAKQQILYVGKAKNLKRRVTSYFRKLRDPKTKLFMAQVKEIEIAITPNENAALLLEHNLIKTKQPRYNILFKDDKSFPYLFLSRHEFPRLGIHRGAIDNKSGKYFGPFPHAAAVNFVFNLLQKIFRVRVCKDSFMRNRTRPCMLHQIKLCSAPCVGHIDKTAYSLQVKLIAQFLNNRDDLVVNELTKLMDVAAAKLAYEQAANYRNQIIDIRRVQAEQAINQQQLVTLRFTAVSNVSNALKIDHVVGTADYSKYMDDFKQTFRLAVMPQRIECFDVSHNAGEAAVASCVVFDKHGPNKKQYRRFNIKTVNPGDDYSALREALSRRYGNFNLKDWPDVIMVDGGRGQLNIAAQVMQNLSNGFNKVILLAIAKGRDRRLGQEEIYMQGTKLPIILSSRSQTLRFMQQIRDEAHRFAISSHRKKMLKARHKSELDDIKGIGKAKRISLLKHFGGLSELKSVGVDELAKVRGVGPKLAVRIYDCLHA